MPRDPQVLVFVGIKGSVMALDERTGERVWQSHLRTEDYVSILWDGQSLFASNSGEVWRIDPKNGNEIWHNQLKGLGRGLVSLASSRRPTEPLDMSLAAEKQRRDAQAAATAAAAT